MLEILFGSVSIFVDDSPSVNRDRLNQAGQTLDKEVTASRLAAQPQVTAFTNKVMLFLADLIDLFRNSLC